LSIETQWRDPARLANGGVGAAFRRVPASFFGAKLVPKHPDTP
jgi:hypothetical protein